MTGNNSSKNPSGIPRGTTYVEIHNAPRVLVGCCCHRAADYSASRLKKLRGAAATVRPAPRHAPLSHF